MPSLGERLKRSWNAFINKKDEVESFNYYGEVSSYRPDRIRLLPSNEKSIVAAITTRISIDVAAISIQHVKLDQNGRYVETIKSPLNNCLTLDANLDQTGRAFIQDLVASLLDEGCIAVLPTDTSANPDYTNSYDIYEMRVAKIIAWYPDKVRLKVYNERRGRHEEVTVNKSTVAIIENPLYAVMNEPNSTMKRLVRNMNYLDQLNANNSSGKLDLIIQLPYVIKTDARRKQAETRRKDIEDQLAGSKYGIAYTDGTEKITQLNRSLDNNLQAQIEYLTGQLYGQLGITENVIKGIADEQESINYYNRTIEPILSAITDEMKRKFLTKTARSQNQSISFFRDPFKLVPINSIAEIADKFTRNEILSSNEVRGIIGFKPVNDERADELRNKNLNENTDAPPAVSTNDEVNDVGEDDLNQNESLIPEDIQFPEGYDGI